MLNLFALYLMVRPHVTFSVNELRLFSFGFLYMSERVWSRVCGQEDARFPLHAKGKNGA